MLRVFTANMHGKQHHHNKKVTRVIKRIPYLRFAPHESFPDQLQVELECGSTITVTENLVYESKD